MYLADRFNAYRDGIPTKDKIFESELNTIETKKFRYFDETVKGNKVPVQ